METPRVKLAIQYPYTYIQILQSLNTCIITEGNDHTQDTTQPPRSYQFKSTYARTYMDIRKKFFNVRGIPLWNSLPNLVTSLSNINTFKAGLADPLDFISS